MHLPARCWCNPQDLRSRAQHKVRHVQSHRGASSRRRHRQHPDHSLVRAGRHPQTLCKVGGKISHWSCLRLNNGVYRIPYTVDIKDINAALMEVLLPSDKAALV